MQVKRSSTAPAPAELNVLPLKYHEAYRIYKQMKANHLEPDVIDMTKDCAQWNSTKLSARERWIIEMGIGYFSAAEVIVGDSVLHVIEENLTAAELKYASLRQIMVESYLIDLNYGRVALAYGKHRARRAALRELEAQTFFQEGESLEHMSPGFIEDLRLRISFARIGLHLTLSDKDRN